MSSTMPYLLHYAKAYIANAAVRRIAYFSTVMYPYVCCNITA